MSAYLKITRPLNLFIVVLTQFLLEYLILIPAFQLSEYQLVLDEFHFALLSLVTVLIAASGYVINDIEDHEIDLVNKGEKAIVGNRISIASAQKYYWVLVILGLLLSVYLAIYAGNILLVLIYPLAVFLLWWYSKQLKQIAFWGNFVVAVFCAFVAGIVLFAEREAFWNLVQSHTEIGKDVTVIFIVYLGFAFFSTLFREIVKDIEDLEGDMALGCETLPIVFGITKAKQLAAFFALLLLGVLFYFSFYFYPSFSPFSIVFLVLFIFSPILFALQKLHQAKTKKEFRFLSQLAKFVMLGGIFLLFISRIH